MLDDSHDEGDEALTLRLSNASGGRLADAEATGTIENTDPLPRALLARFGRATALHVMEQVEERLEVPRAPGLRGRFAGRELRRGMEREMGRTFLSRLESTAVQGVQGNLGGAELLRMGLGGGDLLMGSGFVLNRETDQGGSVSLCPGRQSAGSRGPCALVAAGIFSYCSRRQHRGGRPSRSAPLPAGMWYQVQLDTRRPRRGGGQRVSMAVHVHRILEVRAASKRWF